MPTDTTYLILIAALAGIIIGGLAVHWMQPYCCRLQPEADENGH